MRRALMDILCCPMCKGDLALKIEKEDENEILEGELLCSVCEIKYPIHEGIPNLLPQTSRIK